MFDNKFKKNILKTQDNMNDLKELEELVGDLEHIEPLGIEPDFSSLGIEPIEVLGFKTEEELDYQISLLIKDINKSQFIN